MSSTPLCLAVFSLFAACLSSAGTTNARETPPSGAGSPFTSGTITTLGPAYAFTRVNAQIFRHHALVSDGTRQFAAWYDPDARVVLGARTLPDGDWTTRTTSWKGNVRNPHNAISLGISPDGILHISYDHHATPLRYRRTSRPLDPATFSPTEPMTGHREGRVTYPQFVNVADDAFLFLYRDGVSGDGELCVNSYSTTSSSWQPLHHPLITGEGEFNPYWCRPAVAADGTISLAWVWRRTGDSSTNQNVSYARSRDGGRTWENSRSEPYRLPITPATAEIIDPTGEGNNISNQDSAESDSRGRTHVVHQKNDPQGITQYFHRWYDGEKWRESQATSFTESFDLRGAQSQRRPLSRANLLIDHQDHVYVLYCDARLGGRPRVVKLEAPDYRPTGDWPLIEEDMKQWEPTYDIARWKRDGVLDLWLLSSGRSRDETTATVTSAPARILELRLATPSQSPSPKPPQP